MAGFPRGRPQVLRISWLLAIACGTTASSAEPAREALDPGVESGRIVGHVTLGPQLTARRKFSLYPDPNRAPRERERSIDDELRNVVIYLESAPTGAVPPARHDAPAISQQKLEFTPHVLAVVKGTTVEFPNRDTVFHNVFSLSKVATFDLGRYPHDGSKSVRFTTPGMVKVFCHIHSDMSAIVVVLDNPFFASPDAAGRFVIDGIPPGEYTVVAWHERARILSRRVRIDAGGVVPVDFDIPLTEPPDGG